MMGLYLMKLITKFFLEMTMKLQKGSKEYYKLGRIDLLGNTDILK